MKTIKVKNCHDCPFQNNDNESGTMCNLVEETDINSYSIEEKDMPNYNDFETVPDKCPLKEDDYNISLIVK